MRTLVTRAVLVLGFLLAAPSAFAQSAYVGAAVGMDVSRFSGAESEFAGGSLQPGGEALAFSLRIGTRVGQNWGVELGFTRPSEVESENTFSSPILLSRLTFPSVGASTSISSSFAGSSRLERRDSTLDTVAWMAQPVGSRVDLVYLGGIAFNRTVERNTFAFRYAFGIDALPPQVFPQAEVARLLPGPTGPNSVRATTYGISPVVGLDARIALTDHLRVVPGMRLQGISGGTNGSAGWLIRPSVSLMWQF